MKQALLTGDTITAVLAGAPGTANPKVNVEWSGSQGPKADVVALSGATPVTLLEALANAATVLTGLSIFNSDTAAVTVTISRVTGGVTIVLTKKTLQVGDTLSADEDGFTVSDVNGQVKTVLAQTAAGRVEAAVTATTGGGTTGLIPAGSTHITVTSDSVNKTISLPAASVGDVIRIKMGATGCELISSVATHKVNDVLVGATNEAALVATNIYRCEYVATDEWIVTATTKLGAVVTALVPDALN